MKGRINWCKINWHTVRNKRVTTMNTTNTFYKRDSQPPTP